MNEKRLKLRTRHMPMRVEEGKKNRYNRADVKEDTKEEALVAIDIVESEIADCEERIRNNGLNSFEIAELEDIVQQKKRYLEELNRTLNKL